MKGSQPPRGYERAPTHCHTQRVAFRPMSGFRRGHDTYQLTTAKAEHWHRRCACGASTFARIMEQHAAPAGFSLVGPHGELSGPGLADGSTDALYAAISTPL